jgi:hypothetical protein
MAHGRLELFSVRYLISKLYRVNTHVELAVTMFVNALLFALAPPTLNALGFTWLLAVLGVTVRLFALLSLNIQILILCHLGFSFSPQRPR